MIRCGLTTIAKDIVPPAIPTHLSITTENGVAHLSWTNPADSDFDLVDVRLDPLGIPMLSSDGELVYHGSGTRCDITTEPGKTYYFGIFAKDKAGNWTSTPVAARLSVPAIPPATVTPDSILTPTQNSTPTDNATPPTTNVAPTENSTQPTSNIVPTPTTPIPLPILNDPKFVFRFESGETPTWQVESGTGWELRGLRSDDGPGMTVSGEKVMALHLKRVSSADECSILSPRIKVPQANAWIKFWKWVNIRSSLAEVRLTIVEVDEVSDRVIKEYPYARIAYIGADRWTLTEYPLNIVAGKIIRIRFTFHPKAIDPAEVRFFLDDLRVSGNL
jgi:hypothetical protein